MDEPKGLYRRSLEFAADILMNSYKRLIDVYDFESNSSEIAANRVILHENVNSMLILLAKDYGKSIKKISHDLVTIRPELNEKIIAEVTVFLTERRCKQIFGSDGDE